MFSPCSVIPSMLWGTCTMHVSHATPYKIRLEETVSTSGAVLSKKIVPTHCAQAVVQDLFATFAVSGGVVCAAAGRMPGT